MVLRRDGFNAMPIGNTEGDVVFSEETPTYKRIAGEDIAGDPPAAIQEIVERMRDIDISPFLLKDLDTFEQTFVALMILKFHMLVSKQKDYGPGNISKAGMRGLITRATDKLERVKTLVGDPEQQVEDAKAVLRATEDDAPAGEMAAVLKVLDGILNPSNTVRDERIDDTLMDLGNYGDIGFILHHGAWGKALEEDQ